LGRLVERKVSVCAMVGWVWRCRGVGKRVSVGPVGRGGCGGPGGRMMGLSIEAVCDRSR
jgi:hypothetical protein